MSKRVPALALVCVVAGLAGYWCLRPKVPAPISAAPLASQAAADAEPAVKSGQARPTAAPAMAAPVSGAASGPGSTPSPAAAGVAAMRPAALPYQLGAANSLPADVSPTSILESMRLVIINYGSRFDGNPVGNNAEITSALNGNNPGQVRFIDETSGLRINGQGELVDAWGTPFFFHQLSGTHMEIRSAGPDKKMWTSDDLVTK